jgi:hypothetical protein
MPKTLLKFKLSQVQDLYSTTTTFTKKRRPTFGFEDEHKYIEFIDRPKKLKLDKVVANYAIHHHQKPLDGYSDTTVREKAHVEIVLDHVDSVNSPTSNYFTSSAREFLVDQIPEVKESGFSLGIPEITSSPCVLDSKFDAVADANLQMKSVMLALKRVGHNRLKRGNWEFKELFKEHNFSQSSSKDALDCGTAKVLIETEYFEHGQGFSNRQINLSVRVASLIRGFNHLVMEHGEWSCPHNGYMKNYRHDDYQEHGKAIHFASMMKHSYKAALSYQNHNRQERRKDFERLDGEEANFYVELMGALVIFQIIGFARQEFPSKEIMSLVPKVNPHDIYRQLLSDSKALGRDDFGSWFKALDVNNSFPISIHAHGKKDYLENTIKSYIMNSKEINLIINPGKRSEDSEKDKQPSQTQFVIRSKTLPYDETTRSFIMEFRRGCSAFNKSSKYIFHASAPKGPLSQAEHKKSDENTKKFESFVKLFE